MERAASLPVVSSGLSLASSTVITAGLGLFFWIIASRIYVDEAEFGVGATAISTMMMLADLACVGLRTGLVKFVPTLGSQRPRIVTQAYSIAFVTSSTVAMVFLVGLGLWAPRLSALTATLVTAVFFVLATSFWSTFILEDSVLTGIRKARWVPVENAVFGVAKIALLWPMSTISSELGVFLAWALPVFPIVIGVNLLIVVRTLRAQPPAQPQPGDEPIAPALTVHGTRNATSAADLGLPGLLSYSSADWLASVARLAATGVGPLLVLGVVGQAAAGYFNIAWLVAYTTFLLSINVSDAMLAESSFDLGDLNANSRHALLLSLALTAPIVLVGVTGAPLILNIFGQRFADNGSGLLRLLLLAAIPNVAYQTFLGRLRSLGRMRAVIALEAALATVVLAVGVVALRRMGLAGIGLAWLIGLGSLGLIAVIVETQWWWASQLDTRLVRTLGRRLGWFRRPRVSPEAQRLLAGTVASADINPSGPPTWVSINDERWEARINSADRVHTIVIPCAPMARSTVRRHARILDELRTDSRLESLRSLLPTVKPVTDQLGRDGLVISRPHGITGTELLIGGRGHRSTPDGRWSRFDGDPDRFCQRVVEAIEPLYRVTTDRRAPTDRELRSWVDEPIDRIGARGRATKSELDGLRRLLRTELEDHELIICRGHGQLTPGHVVVHGETGELSAILGWTQSDCTPYGLDYTTLRITAEAAARSEELGAVVRSALDDPERLLPTDRAETPTLALPNRVSILLAWLLLVGQDQPSGTAVLPNLFWASRNVQPVLAAVSGATEVW